MMGCCVEGSDAAAAAGGGAGWGRLCVFAAACERLWL